MPGIDYLDFEELGSECPEAHLYDDVCRRCWPEGCSARSEAAGAGGAEEEREEQAEHELQLSSSTEAASDLEGDDALEAIAADELPDGGVPTPEFCDADGEWR